MRQVSEIAALTTCRAAFPQLLPTCWWDETKAGWSQWNVWKSAPCNSSVTRCLTAWGWRGEAVGWEDIRGVGQTLWLIQPPFYLPSLIVLVVNCPRSKFNNLSQKSDDCLDWAKHNVVWANNKADNAFINTNSTFSHMGFYLECKGKCVMWRRCFIVLHLISESNLENVPFEQFPAEQLHCYSIKLPSQNETLQMLSQNNTLFLYKGQMHQTNSFTV